MSILSSMDLPTIDVDLGPKKIENDEKDGGGPLFHCNLCDTEVVHKLAQMFLPGLASACVDNTSGGLFKTPGSVTVDLRKEMIEYLTLRSESFVAESVILEGGGGPDDEVSDHPFDIISNFVDDFALSKRNLFSRVSGWLLSEKREDKIDDFIQEIDMNGFWTLDRRETIAQTLLKNVDFKNSFHCTASFNSSQELANHVIVCDFRPMICQNQGCNTKFCAGHLNKHDSTCPFKIIPCEQRCSNSIMRRDMDRHCITVCPMKLVNCPFFAVGCRSAVAQCMIEKHCLDDVQSHLWHLLKGRYKEASGEDLKQRVEQIVQASPSSHLSKARDVRSLNFIVKDIEAKLGPLEVGVQQKICAENITEKVDSDTNTNNGSEQSTQASDMFSSSDKGEVSDILTMHTAENIDKSEESEQSLTEIKGSDERIHTSNITMLPDEVEIGLVNEGITQNYKENTDAAACELKFKSNEEKTQTDTEKLAKEISGTNEDNVEAGLVREGISQNYKENNDGVAGELKFKSNEENTQTNMEKLAEEISGTNEDSIEAGLVSEGITQNYKENNDAAASELKFKSNEEKTQTDTEKLAKEISGTNEDSVEAGLVSEGISQNYKENNDGVAGELKFKSNEENTQTNMEKLAEEISGTNEDCVKNSMKNRLIEDDNFEDNDNVQSINNSYTETAGSAENNVKNKDIEYDNLK